MNTFPTVLVKLYSLSIPIFQIVRNVFQQIKFRLTCDKNYLFLKAKHYRVSILVFLHYLCIIYSAYLYTSFIESSGTIANPVASSQRRFYTRMMLKSLELFEGTYVRILIIKSNLQNFKSSHLL